MTDDDIVISNLRTLLEIFGSCGGTRLSSQRPGLTLYDSGTGSAYENYALISPALAEGSSSDVRELAEYGVDFFSRFGSPHIWPLFPRARNAKDILEGLGAREDDTFYGMALDLGGGAALDAFPRGGEAVDEVWVSGGPEAEEWAKAAWLGFDSEEPVPGSFVDFTKEAVKTANAGDLGRISLLALRYGGGGPVAATGMICECQGTAGIYYVSSCPSFRRRGLGLRVMKALVERGVEDGCGTACLLATPAGKPLYLKCGFKLINTAIIMLYGE